MANRNRFRRAQGNAPLIGFLWCHKGQHPVAGAIDILAPQVPEPATCVIHKDPVRHVLGAHAATSTGVERQFPRPGERGLLLALAERCDPNHARVVPRLPAHDRHPRLGKNCQPRVSTLALGIHVVSRHSE